MSRKQAGNLRLEFTLPVLRGAAFAPSSREKVKTIALSAFVFFISGTPLVPLHAQSYSPPLIKSTTRLVQVTVIATGHKGALIEGLTKDDFEIFEQGALRRIATFSHAEAGGSVQHVQAKEGQLSNQEKRQRSSVNLVLLDRANTDRENWVRGLNQITSFFSALTTDDRLAVYLLDPRNGLQVVQDYSEKSHNLPKSLEVWIDPHSRPDPALSPEPQSAPQLSFSKRDTLLPAPEFLSSGRLPGLIDALKVIGDHVSGIPGRKSLIWFASAFPDTFGPIPRRNGLPDPYRSQMLRALNSLIASNVAIYPVDARGLTPDPAFDVENQEIGLGPGRPNSPRTVEFSERELAHRSGGKACINTNGFCSMHARSCQF